MHLQVKKPNRRLKLTPANARTHIMPKGPRGEKRPSDVIGNAVKVMKIATGEIEEDTDESPPKDEAAADLGRRGGKARADKLTKKRRSEIAKKTAAVRWVCRGVLLDQFKNRQAVIFGVRYP